jgi:NAD(P)H-dependent FMN reductase
VRLDYNQTADGGFISIKEGVWMVNLQIILGSTRPGRNGEAVANWVCDRAEERDDFEVELVDVADYGLPLLDEPISPSQGKYSKGHTKRWANKIAEADGFIVVTAEYNHSIPGALKNAIDYLYAEWNNKACGFVSYGSNGGSRAVEHLRGVAAEVQMADVREQLMLYLDRDFESHHTFKPTERHAAQLEKVFDQVVTWSEALQPVRADLIADIM